jgi:flagellin
MTRINTNVESLRGLHNVQKAQNQLSTSLTRLSTGLAINNGRDNPAGLLASEGLRLQITTIEQSIKNSNRANNVLGTADSALGEIGGLLNQVRGLVQEALNNGALSADEIKANQQQIDQALSAINRISANTSFGGQKLIDGSKAFHTATSVADAAKLSDLQINEALFGTSSSIAVNATITTAATKGELRYNNGTLSSAVTLEVAGSKGNQVLFLGGSSTVGNIRDAVNAVSDVTGVNATLRAGEVVGGGAAGAAVAATRTATTVTAQNAVAASQTFNSNGAGVLTVTADTAGAAGNSIQVEFVVAGNNTALSATQAGNVITVNLATDGGGLVVDASNTADLIAAEINGIVGGTASASGNGQAGGYVAAAAANLQNGADAVVAENITFTAVAGGFAGNNISVAIAAGAANGVTVTGNTIAITRAAGTTTAQLVNFLATDNSAGAVAARALVTASGTGTTAIDTAVAAGTLSGGVDGTGGGVKFTDARAEGSSGTLSVVFANPGANNAALSISTSAANGNGDRTITVNLATNGTGAITSTAAEIVAAIANDATASTLVNAKVDTAGVVGAVASTNLVTGNNAELVFKSASFGSSEYVQLNLLSGTFVTTLDDETTVSYRDSGTNIQAIVNGQAALGDGLDVVVKTGLLDAKLSFNAAANVANTTASVTITGGGSLFQIGQQADSSGQIGLGIEAVNTARLGGISGKLYELASGGGKTLLDVGPTVPASTLVDIIDQALNRVNTLRGRLGAIQKNVIDTNISNLGVALENISAARSQIVDTDFAAETAALQKAQVLSQAGISVLTIANQVPQQVLSLLR